ncbi:ExeM/NucH family extracellular endonuclease [Marinobacter nanhaiticus D15-8W]|uniref:DNA degradation protein EddB n=1 Tax=Marinobacter nanhaiticus D15-8W TaxID=626887 RepID=N6VZ31_9GAMM|nr:ExeM/NucH family extracellular endonuclease [Marinobacter nanhaiticus]ENO15535.1 DNA degradation protein EddB [Marinobacter nanhaiticus D15-8W]BES73615.1 ExeM/NucH family extracellular endonuclease [Marinobacter nanhaiticus D15-8W]
MKMRHLALASAIAGLLAGQAQADLVISEYIEGSSNNKAIELLNTGSGSVDLTAWELQVYFNGSSSPGLTLDLQGNVAPGANHVYGHSLADPAILAVADQTTGAGMYNGDDAVVLLNGGAIVDSIGQVGVDPGSYWGNDDTRTQNQTLRRRTGTSPDADPFNAFDPAANYDAFPQDSFDDLGAAGGNDDGDPTDPDPTAPDMTCGAPATLISAIQGSGNVSPMVDSNVVVEATVSAYAAGDDGLGGFYIQEEAGDQDGNAATSEALFVYEPGAAANVGDQVRVAGTVVEYNGLTELTSVSALTVCGSGPAIQPTVISLPWTDESAPEAWENMLVTLEQPLTVTDNYDLGRYGSLTLGSGRHFIPTNVAAPGAEAQLVAEMNALDSLILDDGSNAQNPAVVPYPAPQLSAVNTVRAGDEVQYVVGVLDYRFDAWRLQPTQQPSFNAVNERTDAPALDARGNLVVASFNVLNFFNGDGMGGGFPTARGANDPSELQRQTDKLVSAIRALDADIVGLMEIENDGYGDESAVAELADALGDEWDYVDPGLEQLGGDAIAVAIIYRSDRVETVGEAATLTGPSFQDLNRQPLAQTFRLLDSEDGLTVVVNHLKSKGCGDADGANADQGDGQGCWNAARTQAARALSTWLANDATGSGEEDVLIIGDLNAYAMEDPISALKSSGYANLVDRFIGGQAYSYVFYGDAGYLDHALANSALADKVIDTTIWHINADEPRILDYNLEYQTPEQQASLYAPDAYRASDHDPVIIALEMGTAPPSASPDINGDGRIDGRDLARLTLALLFGRGDVERYDIDGDGRVNVRDLFALLQAKHDARRTV